VNVQTTQLYEENLRLKEYIKSLESRKMNFIMKLLHMIPFVHFYTPWSDTKECGSYGGYERQQRFCTICNKKQYQVVKNSQYE
jgi:hypothetical protein